MITQTKVLREADNQDGIKHAINVLGETPAKERAGKKFKDLLYHSADMIFVKLIKKKGKFSDRA